MTDTSSPASGADRLLHIVERRDDGGDPGLVVVGELDIATVPVLRRSVSEVLLRSPTRLILDLHGVDFIDSSGLAVLLELVSTIGRVEIFQPSAAVRRVIELSGLAAVLPMTQ